MICFSPLIPPIFSVLIGAFSFFPETPTFHTSLVPLFVSRFNVSLYYGNISQKHGPGSLGIPYDVFLFSSESSKISPPLFLSAVPPSFLDTSLYFVNCPPPEKPKHAPPLLFFFIFLLTRKKQDLPLPPFPP